MMLNRLNLQPRFFIIMGTSVLCFVLGLWWVINQEGEKLVERIGARFAEKQVLYDKARTLQPLIREVALARKMADSAIIKQWAQNEGDPKLLREAMAEVEMYRQHFQDGSYFLALANSGNYYFNDASKRYANKQLRYRLDPEKPADSWFYATLKSGDEYQINVDPDVYLGVTKVWINVLLRDGDRILGVVGTGLDLTDFIREVADIPQPGITNLFVNRNAAIQIYRDIGYIDFSSIAKPTDEQRSIDQILDVDGDRVWIRQAIARLSLDGESVATRFVRIEGKRYLAAVAALPEVGWFDITLLDLTVLLPRHDFLQMGLSVAGAALLLLLVLAFTLHKLVVRPVSVLTDAVSRIGRGDYAPAPLEKSAGEVGQLTTQFQVMADAVHKTHNWLEHEIDERTRQLADTAKILEVSLQQEKNARENQGNLMALIAHEIRSPVAVIGNTAQMLNVLVQAERPDWQPRIDKIMGAVRQLAQLMDNFLAEDRLGTNNSGLEFQPDNLDVYCAELVKTLESNYGRKIGFQPCDSNVCISADWQLIGIAIGNLVGNAVKYSPGEGEIRVVVKPGNTGTMCVEVVDQGGGIAPELQQRIFEKFIRGQHRERIHGTGLGLYLVDWIARFHGGYAEVDSAPGKGSAFRICLPLTQIVH
jgi:signal transduction histidine kinase